MDQSRIFRDVASGSFILLRYKDAREILADNALWKDPEKAEPAAVLLEILQARKSRQRLQCEHALARRS